jgi:hypothetical protein
MRSDQDLTSRMMTTDRFPIRYLFIPKNGCTYIKNLLWTLQHDSVHSNPKRIHEYDGKMPRASTFALTTEDLALEEHAFAVVRNPVDRFYSLYTDKVVGAGHKMYVPLRKILLDKYGLNASPVTVDDHTRNCEVLIDWLAQNLENEIDHPKEAHWTPQIYRQNVLKEMDLKLLLVEDLTNHLKCLLRDIVPNLEDILIQLEENASKKSYSRSEVITTPLRKKINRVFGKDRRLFQETRMAWSGKNYCENSDIPRSRNILAKVNG